MLFGGNKEPKEDRNHELYLHELYLLKENIRICSKLTGISAKITSPLVLASLSGRFNSNNLITAAGIGLLTTVIMGLNELKFEIKLKKFKDLPVRTLRLVK